MFRLLVVRTLIICLIGILIYVALVHMMKEEMERPEFQKGGGLLYCMYLGFALGTAAMAIIGIWA